MIRQRKNTADMLPEKYSLFLNDLKKKQEEKPVYTQQTETVIKNDPNAKSPIRSTLTGYGISNDRIGYQNGKVTVDGKDFMAPDRLEDGTSYATGDRIKAAFADWNRKNNIVPARSYINSKNPNTLVGWDKNLNQVKVGSVNVSPDYIQDGVAYVRKSVIDDAMRQEASISGISGRQDIYSRNQAKWEQEIADLYDRVQNRGRFSWNPSDDELWQDFKKLYLNNAKRQYDDTIAKMNTQSGGAPSLGAMAAAWNMYKQSQDELSQYKQQFRQQAYNEYLNDKEMDAQALETALSMRDNEFQREYGVVNDIIGDNYNMRDWERQLVENERKDQLWPYELENAELTNEALKFELEQNKSLAPLEVQLAWQKVQAGEIELSQAAMDNLAKQYQALGYTPSAGSYPVYKEGVHPRETEGNFENQIASNIALYEKMIRDGGNAQGTLRQIYNNGLLSDAVKLAVIEALESKGLVTETDLEYAIL